MSDSNSTDGNDDCPQACNDLLSSPPSPPNYCKTSFVFKIEIRNQVKQCLSTSEVFSIYSASLEEVQHSCKCSRHLKELLEKRIYGKEVQSELVRQVSKLVSDGGRNIDECTVEIENVWELESPTVDETEQCAICLESLLDSNKIILPCSHIYHQNCLLQWLNKKQDCPLCRLPLPKDF